VLKDFRVSYRTQLRSPTQTMAPCHWYILAARTLSCRKPVLSTRNEDTGDDMPTLQYPLAFYCRDADPSGSVAPSTVVGDDQRDFIPI